jgi:uncharacterized protein
VYKKMQIEFDWDKSGRNAVKHGFSLADAERFTWYNATIELDTRRDYGEPRFRAFGTCDGIPCCLVFTPRNDKARVISLRRCNRKERELYYGQPLEAAHPGIRHP